MAHQGASGPSKGLSPDINTAPAKVDPRTFNPLTVPNNASFMGHPLPPAGITLARLSDLSDWKNFSKQCEEYFLGGDYKKGKPLPNIAGRDFLPNSFSVKDGKNIYTGKPVDTSKILSSPVIHPRVSNPDNLPPVRGSLYLTKANLPDVLPPLILTPADFVKDGKDIYTGRPVDLATLSKRKHRKRKSEKEIVDLVKDGEDIVLREGDIVSKGEHKTASTPSIRPVVSNENQISSLPGRDSDIVSREGNIASEGEHKIASTPSIRPAVSTSSKELEPISGTSIEAVNTISGEEGTQGTRTRKRKKGVMPYNNTAIPPSEEITGSTSLPLARVKRIIQSDEEISPCSNSAAFAITVATEIFVRHLAGKSLDEVKAERKPRRNIQYKDVANAVARNDNLEFLSDVVPKTVTYREFKRRKAEKDKRKEELQKGQTTLNASRAPPKRQTEVIDVDKEFPDEEDERVDEPVNGHDDAGPSHVNGNTDMVDEHEANDDSRHAGSEDVDMD